MTSIAIRQKQHLELIRNNVLKTNIYWMPFILVVKFDVVDFHDLAKAKTSVANSLGHLYATNELAGPEALSQRDMAHVISPVLGREIRTEALSLEVMVRNARAVGASEHLGNGNAHDEQAIPPVWVSGKSQFATIENEPQAEYGRGTCEKIGHWK